MALSLVRYLGLALTVSVGALSSACLDWESFGDGPGLGGGDDDDDDDDGGEGEGEGDGEQPSGPRWVLIDAPVTAQAELAAGTAVTLSSSGGRLFAVGPVHVFELVDDALVAVADVAVPCSGVTLSGPVAVDGTDLLVAAGGNTVRFHADGSCDPAYAAGSQYGIAALAGGALAFDGQTLRLVDTDGLVVDTHQFDTFTQGAFYPDGARTDSVLLVLGSNISGGGQVVRVTMPSTEIVIEAFADSAGFMAGSTPAAVFLSSRFDATFVDLYVGDAIQTGPQSAELRVSDVETIADVAVDANSGELAVVGQSALTVRGSVTTPSLTSVTGERYGALSKIARAPGGEVWVVGDDVILYWSAASASAFKAPDIVHSGVDVNADGLLVAIDGSLFFGNSSLEILRADVDGGGLDIVNVIDSVSFAPVSFGDFQSRGALVVGGGGEGARLVEVGTLGLAVYELDDDLGAVTARLSSAQYSFLSGGFYTVTGIAVLGDASKAAFVVDSGLFHTCSLELPRGQTPLATCDAGRSPGVNGRAITVIDPTAGVDDETYIVTGNGAVSILEPGESGRTFNVATDQSVRSLLVQDCLLAFSSSQQSWSAINQEQPLAPAARRGFPVSDALVVGDRVLLVGPTDGSAGQLATIPAPADGACDDDGGAPVLDDAKLLGGELRSQTHLFSAAFVDGELYALDRDGLLWHVPTP